jgi:hypothetical protein
MECLLTYSLCLLAMYELKWKRQGNFGSADVKMRMAI